jgi:hypothetical protein
MQASSEFEQLKDLYGPEAAHSDYQRGQRIAFTEGREIVTGIILWVAAATNIAGRDVPMEYIVELDSNPNSFPTMVTPAQVVESRYPW